MTNRLFFAGLKLTVSRESSDRAAFGTCFPYRSSTNSWWLVTALHTLRGVHPETGKLLGSFVPDRAEMKIPTRMPDGLHVGWLPGLAVRHEDGCWLAHPDAPSVDIAVMRLEPGVLPQEEHPHVRPANDMTSTEFEIVAGMDVFVLGYPDGFTGGGGFAVLKRGTIATHTGFRRPTPVAGDHFLIDTATRHGMSGGPAFAHMTGIVHDEALSTEEAVEAGQFAIGEGWRFVGMYTSRPLPDSAATLAQLGLVFHTSEIERAIAEGRPWDFGI